MLFISIANKLIWLKWRRRSDEMKKVWTLLSAATPLLLVGPYQFSCIDDCLLAIYNLFIVILTKIKGKNCYLFI